MRPAPSRRLVLQSGLALGAALVLPRAHGCEFFASTMRIVHPWARETPGDAPFAIVCMKFDEVLKTDRLIGIQSFMAARAELGGPRAGEKLDLEIPQGVETVLAEDGLHIRLVGLRHPLHLGRSYGMRLVFAEGGTVNAQLNVDLPRRPG